MHFSLPAGVSHLIRWAGLTSSSHNACLEVQAFATGTCFSSAGISPVPMHQYYTAGMLGAPAKVDAMLGSRAQLGSNPQQLESTAPVQQPLFAPVARSTGQPSQPGLSGMYQARGSLPLPAFASGSAEAAGAGLFRAAQMPMQPAANPMTLHLYQALMAASMMGVSRQHPLQEGAGPCSSTPSCHGSASIGKTAVVCAVR